MADKIFSDNIHDVIGMSPVLDQFELFFTDEYSGSYGDDIVLGNLVSKTSQNSSLTQGTRIRKLSSLGSNIVPWGDPNTDTYPTLGLSVEDIAINPYKSKRIQPWYEVAGFVTTNQTFDNNERIYDSMMPAISDCFAVDGSSIFIGARGSVPFGHPARIDTFPGAVYGLSVYPNSLPPPSYIPVGWIILDFPGPFLLSNASMTDPDFPDWTPLVNLNWNKSFPFEPRYSDVARTLDVSKSLIANYSLDIYASNPSVVVKIPSTPVKGLFVGTSTKVTAVDTTGRTVIMGTYVGDPVFHSGSYGFEWISDVNLSSKTTTGWFAAPSAEFPSTLYLTSSANINDISRTLFGFGDRNTRYNYVNPKDSGSYTAGTNHFVDVRNVIGPHPDVFLYDYSNFSCSPSIRGWKYGVFSGLPSYSKSYWRRGKYGQFRDMLEQRQFTKFYDVSETQNANQTTYSAVNVKFLDQDGKLTSPENTWSNNLSLECTSSLPYFDGLNKSRPSVNIRTLNLSQTTVSQDSNGNIQIA